LTAHPTSELIQLASQLADNYVVTLTSQPQAGLGLLKMTDGAFHEPFYLGEFPLSNCSVELSLADGRCVQGGAQVMADDAELARALAVMDGILAGKLPGWEAVAELVVSGNKLREEEQSRRDAILNVTRVDFALLTQKELSQTDSPQTNTHAEEHDYED
jgi:alpha-D-ribose 1-methylphosphonate 5-triphosphate synthase subunit PhnG